MQTFSDFIESEAIEPLIERNLARYRNKFRRIIKKAAVGPDAISEVDALNKIKKIRSWNWMGFVFGGLWGIYRRQPIGWYLIIPGVFLAVLGDTISSPVLTRLANIYPVCTMVIFGLYGDNFLLRSSLRTYLQTGERKRLALRHPAGVVLALFLSLVLSVLFAEVLRNWLEK